MPESATVNRESDGNSSTASKFRLLSYEAILITLITAIGYFLAYRYEVGFLDYFGAPIEFASVDLLGVVKFASAFTSIFFILAMLAPLIPTDWSGTHPYVAHYSKRLAVIFFASVFIPFLLMGLREKMYWIAGFVIFLFLASLYLLFPLLVYRKEGNLKARYDAAMRREERQGPSIATQISQTLGSHAFLIIGLFAGCSFLAYLGGRSEALAQKKFLVMNGDFPCVVLRLYGENAVCGELDREANTIGSRFRMIKLTESSAPAINREKLILLAAPSEPK